MIRRHAIHSLAGTVFVAIALGIPTSASAQIDACIPVPAAGLTTVLFLKTEIRGTAKERARLPKHLGLETVGAKSLSRSVRAIYATRRVDAKNKTTYGMIVLLVNRSDGKQWLPGPSRKHDDIEIPEVRDRDAYASVRIAFRKSHTSVFTGGFSGFGTDDVVVDGELRENNDVSIGSNNFVTDSKPVFTARSGRSVFEPGVVDRSLKLGKLDNGRAFDWRIKGATRQRAVFLALLGLGYYELRSAIDILETAGGVDLNHNGVIAGQIPPGLEWPH